MQDHATDDCKNRGVHADTQTEEQDRTHGKSRTTPELTRGYFEIPPPIVQPADDVCIARRFPVNAGITKPQSRPAPSLLGACTARQFFFFNSGEVSLKLVTQFFV